MKLIYADMSIAQALSSLNVLGIDGTIVLDLEFGFSALMSKVNACSFVDERVYVTNVPEVISMVLQSVEEDHDDATYEKVARSCFELTHDLKLQNLHELYEADMAKNDALFLILLMLEKAHE